MMAASWTTESVLNLAPDASSAKAGQGLAVAKKWVRLGSGEGLLWGECQGSGANPYQVKVDPEGPSTSCSCPSRKFPCKHALGLMLVHAASPSAFPDGPLPPWVVSWREGREKRAEKAKEKAERGPAPVDPVAKAKRESARSAKVTAGLDDLSLFLTDVVRQGFASLGARSHGIWDDQARRLIDAQAPGVARRLRQIDEMVLSGEGWQMALLDRMARLHLLIEGHRRLERLPAETAEDVRSAIGFPTDLESVRSGPGVRDQWQVLGQTTAVEDRLIVSRTWLIGRRTRRNALILDFAAGGKALELTLPFGVVVDAEIAFFPGSMPLRALVKERFGGPEPLDEIVGGTTITEAFASFGSALASDPWLELLPVVLENVFLQEENGAWRARDAAGYSVSLSDRFVKAWRLMALSGGGVITLCGEFDGATLDPLACRAAGKTMTLVNKDPDVSRPVAVAPPVPIPELAEATACALVGVDRRPPPTSLKAPFSGLSELGAHGPAARLLALAAATSLYGRVGRKPMGDARPFWEACPDDEQVECGPEEAALLRRMLAGEHTECLAEWLGLAGAAGRRLPHDLLVDMLERGSKREVSDRLLRPVLGARGRWLAAKVPAWRKIAGLEANESAQTVWETGAGPERLIALREVREADPARGRELVVATFASDPADFRAKALGEFATGLSMEDEPFLEGALDDRSKEVRRAAADLLRSLPESRLCARMVERAQGILTWDAGQLLVVPPVAMDKAMTRDGVNAKPTHEKLGERAWLLQEVLSAVPPHAYASWLDAGPEELVKANHGGEWDGLVWSAWGQAAIRHHEGAWAEALFQHWPDNKHGQALRSRRVELLKAVEPNRRDALLLELLKDHVGPFKASDRVFTVLSGFDDPIGPTVGREVLARLRQVVDLERAHFADDATRSKLTTYAGRAHDHQYHEYPLLSFIEGLGGRLPADLAEDAAAALGPAVSDLAYEAAYSVMTERLRFRRAMRREFEG